MTYDEHVDNLARTLATRPSRRGFVASLVAGALAIAGVSQATAKPGKSKGKGKAKGAGQPKVGICHQTGDGGYVFISVAQPAAAAHQRNHGDVVCPTSDDPCLGYRSCDQTSGACLTEPVGDGTACTDAEGMAGTCQSGVCTVAVESPPGGERAEGGPEA